jgi:hypothetical protein
MIIAPRPYSRRIPDTILKQHCATYDTRPSQEIADSILDRSSDVASGSVRIITTFRSRWLSAGLCLGMLAVVQVSLHGSVRTMFVANFGEIWRILSLQSEERVVAHEPDGTWLWSGFKQDSGS